MSAHSLKVDLIPNAIGFGNILSALAILASSYRRSGNWNDCGDKQKRKLASKASAQLLFEWVICFPFTHFELKSL